MVGRAGRFGLDIAADSYICLTKGRENYDKPYVLKLMGKDRLEPVSSTFYGNNKGLARLILD